VAEIHPALRAALDQEIEEVAQGVLCKAAEHDGKDILEANVDLMNDLLTSGMGAPGLAAAAAMMALRLHRSGGR
jgi:hypothetical protein